MRQGTIQTINQAAKQVAKQTSKQSTQPRMLQTTKQNQQGFTLIEVLVALVIVAVALSALSRALGLSVSNQSHLENRVVANWVAQDSLLRQQMFPTQSMPKEVDMLGREWHLERRFAATAVPGYQQVWIEVKQQTANGAEENPAASLASIIAKTAE